VVVACVLLPAAAAATPPEVSGEAAVSWWSSDRRLNDDTDIAVGRVNLAVGWKPSEHFSVRADGLLMSAPDRLGGERTSTSMKEVFVELRSLPCTPALGKRFVAWGKTDALNPTDQVSPVNHRRLVARDADQRTGVWGVHLNCALGPGRLQSHALDRFRFNEVPLARRPGVEFQQDTPHVRPTGALRYEVLGEAADWSASFIDGHDLYPTLALRSMSAQGLRVGRDATRMRLVGADLATTHGSIAYRAEAAWVEYPGQTTGLHAQRRPYAFAVMQAERSIGDRQTIAVQAFVKQLRGRPGATGNPQVDELQRAQALVSNEVDRRQYGVTVRYAQPLWESRADMDVFLVYARPRGDWMLRGRLDYALSDRWRLGAGFDVFRGPVDSYLGNLRANSLALLELSAAW
jgi:hypothetical protein